MRKPAILITGASGEVGHGLIRELSKGREEEIIALDLQLLEADLLGQCSRFVQGDILDPMLLGRLVGEFEIRVIYHLASILSTKAEHNPEGAHRVNVEGTLNLLRLAHDQSQWQARPVRFLYPSSIAVYGLPDAETKARSGKVKENEWCLPTTMYGCNKLYAEHLGRYYAEYYQQLGAQQDRVRLDFRCVRFPGLISAVTLPTGGTSDFAPEMVHSAAQGRPYRCYVRPDTRLPFMAMPDAVKALLVLAEAPRERLTQHVYNVGSFSLSAQELYERTKRSYPSAEVTFDPDRGRQAIVDSWPADVDDGAARRDWGWRPDYDEVRAFGEYLIPAVAGRYHPASAG
ncbi:MAG: NAD-dependent epimerase/dehydratase family protein [Anaerolineales bacterium]|jgi:nucleoside-diphosphate-sugar epimerase